MDDAVLVSGKDNDFVLFNQFFVSVEDMNIFNGFVDKPLLSGLPLVSIEIFEVLESP
jgi:hypothetical protein